MKNLFIGIDFSKEKLDVAVITAVGLSETAPRIPYQDSDNWSNGLSVTPMAYPPHRGSSAVRTPEITANPYATSFMERDTTFGWKMPRVSRMPLASDD